MVHPSWWGLAFERLADVSPARIVVLRWDGGRDPMVEWGNRAAAALIGVDVGELVGRRVSEVYPTRYVDEVVEQLRQAREHGSVTFEVVRELPAGRRTLNATTISLEDDLFVSLALDVTAEREAERRLQQVTELTGAGLYHWNVAEDELGWNDQMFELLGYEAGAFNPTTGDYLRHVHPNDRAELEQATAARTKEEAISQSRHRIIRCDGRIRTVDLRAQPVTDPTGRLLYVLGVARDVTDEVELQRHAELVRRAAHQQRMAVHVQDKVVQALASVVLALDLDEIETARSEALSAVTAAQAVVADLLEEASVHGTIAPGALRVDVEDDQEP
jgi:PAS domain S-box-containing protein